MYFLSIFSIFDQNSIFVVENTLDTFLVLKTAVNTFINCAHNLSDINLKNMILQ